MATRRAKQKQKAITLSGSTKQVVEFFEYSVNNILYQRDVYPADDFKLVKKYGLNLYVSADEALERYIQTIMRQVHSWLLAGNLSRLVMAIVSKETRETLERWQFDVRLEDRPPPSTTTTAEGGKENEAPPGATTTPTRQQAKEKPDLTDEQVQKDIQAIMRNITSTVAFLPALRDKCAFTILAYTDKDTEVPAEWMDSDPHGIRGNAEQVKLRSFSTNIHNVEALVAYAVNDDE